VPVRKVVNKFTLSTSAYSSNLTMTYIPSDTEMDVDNNIIKEKTSLSNKANLKSLSISSKPSTIPHHKCMEINNDLLDDEVWDPINSSQLSYVGETEVGDLVRTSTDNDFISENQCGGNKVPTLKKAPKPHGKGKNRTIDESNLNSSENVMNIQLPYNINQVMELDIYDGNFHLVLLHGSINHLAFDVKNIKESLYCITKYILNKRVENSKTNDINDLKDIGEAA